MTCPDLHIQLYLPFPTTLSYLIVSRFEIDVPAIAGECTFQPHEECPRCLVPLPEGGLLTHHLLDLIVITGMSKVIDTLSYQIQLYNTRRRIIFMLIENNDNIIIIFIIIDYIDQLY